MNNNFHTSVIWKIESLVPVEIVTQAKKVSQLMIEFNSISEIMCTCDVEVEVDFGFSFFCSIPCIGVVFSASAPYFSFLLFLFIHYTFTNLKSLTRLWGFFSIWSNFISHCVHIAHPITNFIFFFSFFFWMYVWRFFFSHLLVCFDESFFRIPEIRIHLNRLPTYLYLSSFFFLWKVINSDHVSSYLCWTENWKECSVARVWVY